MRRLIIPVFLPNMGCPHRCLFCDQRPVTGGAPSRLPSEEDIAAVARTYLATPKARAANRRQMAFYGGTFTLLPEAAQEQLLAIGRGYIERGEIDSLRVSTRPDALDSATLARLTAAGVGTIELGAQSFDDHVLRLSGRGHSAVQTVAAAKLVRESGRESNMELGLQLMCGLPGEDEASFLASCTAAADLAPDVVRLYPVLVLEGTGLAALTRSGGYRPLTIDEAVERCRKGADIFEERATTIGRIGLPPSPELERALLAGPYHPALGQLVRSARWHAYLRRRLAPLLDSLSPGAWAIEAAPGDLSDILGQRGESLRRLKADLNLPALTAVASPDLARGRVRLRETP